MSFSVREKLDLIREGALMEGFNDGSMELYELAHDLSNISLDSSLVLNENSVDAMVAEWIVKGIMFIIDKITKFFKWLSMKVKRQGLKNLIGDKKHILEWKGKIIMQLPKNLIGPNPSYSLLFAPVERWLSKIDLLSTYEGDFKNGGFNKYLNNEINLTAEVAIELIGSTFKLPPNQASAGTASLISSLYSEPTSVSIETLDRPKLISRVETYSDFLSSITSLNDTMTKKLSSLTSTYKHLMIDKKTASQTLRFISAIIRGILISIRRVDEVLTYGYGHMHAVVKAMVKGVVPQPVQSE
jgi:hypothetical protein